MDAARTAFPEFDALGDQFIAPPVRRAGDVLAGVAHAALETALHEGLPVIQRL